MSLATGAGNAQRGLATPLGGSRALSITSAATNNVSESCVNEIRPRVGLSRSVGLQKPHSAGAFWSPIRTMMREPSCRRILPTVITPLMPDNPSTLTSFLSMDCANPPTKGSDPRKSLFRRSEALLMSARAQPHSRRRPLPQFTTVRARSKNSLAPGAAFPPRSSSSGVGPPGAASALRSGLATRMNTPSRLIEKLHPSAITPLLSRCLHVWGAGDHSKQFTSVTRALHICYLAQKVTRVAVPRRPHHALPDSRPHPCTCHWHIGTYPKGIIQLQAVPEFSQGTSFSFRASQTPPDRPSREQGHLLEPVTSHPTHTSPKKYKYCYRT